MSTLRVTTIQSNAGTQGVTQDRLYRGAATAWVNFNGTGSVSANQTIRDSYNVSSCFKNATGDYTVNFTNALTNANFSAVATVLGASFNTSESTQVTAQTTSSARVYVACDGGGGATYTFQDASMVSIAIFGGY